MLCNCATVSPKVVILLGIAAGNSRKRRSGKKGASGEDKRADNDKTPDKDVPIEWGDVLYNGSIFYHTYGKISDPKPSSNSQEQEVARVSFWVGVKKLDFEIRSKNPIVGDRKLGQLGELIGREPQVWKTCAQEAIESLVNGGEHEAGDYRSLPWGRKPEYPWGEKKLPQAHRVTFASGEYVIASETYQEFIRAAFPTEKIYGFDMEAYGVGFICKELGIRFMTIRGVSDFGAQDKEGSVDSEDSGSPPAEADGTRVDGGKEEKKDRYHCAAAAISAAFAKSLIAHATFRELLSKRSEENLHLVRCLDPVVRTGCPGLIRCVDPETRLSAEPVYLSQIYDRIDPMEYSRALEQLTRAGGASSARRFFLYVFPYTPSDLEVLLKANAGTMPMLVKALRDKKWAEFAKEAPSSLPHFKHVNDQAQKACNLNRTDMKPLCSEPPAYGRIIVVSRKSFFRNRNRESMDGNGRKPHPIYGALLGYHVPTFRATREEMKRWGFCVDDVVITRYVYTRGDSQVDPKSSAEGDAKDESDFDACLKEYRYFEQSELLVIRGHHCLAAERANGADGISRNEASRASKLADFWVKNSKNVWDRWQNRRGGSPAKVGPLEVVDLGEDDASQV